MPDSSLDDRRHRGSPLPLHDRPAAPWPPPSSPPLGTPPVSPPNGTPLGVPFGETGGTVMTAARARRTGAVTGVLEVDPLDGIDGPERVDDRGGPAGGGDGEPDGPWRRLGLTTRLRRRAVLAGVAATGLLAAGWKVLQGDSSSLTVPAAPPKRDSLLSAAEAGAFDDRDQSLARSLGTPAPATTELPPEAPAPTLLFPTASEAAAATTVTVPTILATDDPVLHLLRRTTMGITPALVDEVREKGIDLWLAEQLNPGRGDGEGDAAWGMFSRASMTPAQVHGSQERFAWDTMFEVGQATLARMIWSTHQLKEVMADFWANHFNVATPGEGGWDTAPGWHRDVIRQHALGSFTDMLLAVGRHPAMLRFLTNDDNRGESVNENFGRELLELHTVGVASGYTEDDVRNSAYILTGRTVWGENEEGPEGEFRYNPEIHWTGAVTVLGFTHPNDSADGGLDVGDAYLRHLATHPSTAQTIARKLAVRMVSDDPPPALVERLAQAFADADTAIVPMLDVLFRSAEFWASVGQKTRRPLENLVASARAVDVRPGGDTVGFIEDMYWRTGNMGHRPLAWPAPNGYPDVHPAWRSANGLLIAWNTHRGLVQGWHDGASYTEADQLVPGPFATIGEYVDAACRRFCFQTFRPEHRDALITFFETGPDTPISGVDLSDMAGHFLPLVLDSPYFALR